MLITLCWNQDKQACLLFLTFNRIFCNVLLQRANDARLSSLVVLPTIAKCRLIPVQVVDIMRVNVDKVLERDQKLSELDDRADALQAGASQFESCAAKLKNKYWWKNCKVGTLVWVH